MDHFHRPLVDSKARARRENEALEEFLDWLRVSGVLDLVEPLVRTVTVWANYCSPADATAKQLALSYRDLALFFFYIDDYRKPDYGQFLDDCVRIIDGSDGWDGDNPILAAMAEIIEIVENTGLDTSRYRSTRRRGIKTIKRRLDFSTEKGQSTDFKRYYNDRMISVYVYQWMDMWEIIGGFHLSDSERRESGLLRARRIVTSWHILQNDMRSIDRDSNDGAPNLVLLHAESTGDQEESTEYIAALIGKRYREFRAIQDRLEKANPSPAQQKYLTLLEICLTGGRASFEELDERYSMQLGHML